MAHGAVARVAATPAIQRISAPAIARPAREDRAPAAHGWIAQLAPIYTVAIAIALGDGLGNFGIFLPLWFGAALAAAAALAYLMARRDGGRALALAALVAIASVPVRRLYHPAPIPGSIRALPDGALVTIEGMAVRGPELAYGRMRVYVEVERAGRAGAPLRRARGLVRISSADRADIRAGDVLHLTSRIRFPRNNGDWGEFDYQGYMARQGIAATMSTRAGWFGTPAFERIGHRRLVIAGAIESVRDRIGAFIDSTLAFPERAEMRALVIGDRGEIPNELRDTFARAGMAHLLVISGLHLSFVAGAVFAAVRLIMMLFPALASRGYANKAAALAAALAVCAYATIAGGHVSTVRALVMVLAYMFAVMIDRSREALASLALAAIVICIALPGSTADIGFQLSFAAVTAIILGMGRYAAWFARARSALRMRGRRWRIIEIALGYFAVSFWALAGTAPLTAYHFNQFSMVGLTANAVVVPIMGFSATVLGLAAAALSFVWRAPAVALMTAGGALLALSNRLAAFFVAWPAAWCRTFTPTILELGLAYGLIALWLTAPAAHGRMLAIASAIGSRVRRDGTAQSDGGWRARVGVRGACAALFVIALGLDGLWWVRVRYYDPDLRVTFLSVGEGDGAVVHFPGARVMVIDAGGAYAGYDYGERVVAPYLLSRKIMRVDYLVLSHPDLDHFGGFSYLARNFGPSQFWTVRAPGRSESYAELLATLDRLRVPIRFIDTSAPARTIAGVHIEVLNPAAGEIATKNNSSMVLRIAFGATAILFTGDIQAPGERAMLARGGAVAAAIIKVPHHGSATSSSPALIAAVHPMLAVISDGHLNYFHFPNPAVVARYLSAGTTVLRTDRDGAVWSDLDGEDARVEAYDERTLILRPPGGGGAVEPAPYH
jgi:competence protein ComEC